MRRGESKICHRPRDCFVEIRVTNARVQTRSQSDKCSLLAADLAEKVKEADHIKMVNQFGLGFLDFQKFGVAFESSGAFGKTALKVWDRLKYVMVLG